MGSERILTKNYEAEGAWTKFTFLKAGADRDKLIPATAVGDKIIAIAKVDADSGKRGDAILMGFFEIKLGGTVAFGDPLTTDGSSLGVEAAPATGVNNSVGAIAFDAGVSGDIIRCLLTPGNQHQGA